MRQRVGFHGALHPPLASSPVGPQLHQIVFWSLFLVMRYFPSRYLALLPHGRRKSSNSCFISLVPNIAHKNRESEEKVYNTPSHRQLKYDIMPL